MPSAKCKIVYERGDDSLKDDTLKRAKAGDDAALEQIIRDYQRRVGAAVIAIVGDDPDWQDLCQQIFVKMVLGLPRLKDPALFEPWLFRIARNACFDHLRRRRARRFIVPWEPWHDSLSAEPPRHDEEARSTALGIALAQLPDDQRELLTLVRDRAWSYQALARMTGASLGAIKSRLFRARRRLQQLMTEPPEILPELAPESSRSCKSVTRERADRNPLKKDDSDER
jgi:RNA polymerase sigma-70 factor (ECF subfamily)